MQRTIFIIFSLFVCTGLAQNECTYLASDGSFYDLSALTENPDFMTSEINSDTIFYFSICRNTEICADSAACAKTPLGDETILGLVERQSFSEKHVEDGQGVSIVYKGGVNCHGRDDADFVVTLKCDAKVEYVISGFENECSESHAIIRSKYACPQYKDDPSIPIRRSQQVVEETIAETDLILVYITTIASAIIGSVLVVMVVLVIVVTSKKPSVSQDYSPLIDDL